jgi:threonine dehydratase
VAGFVFLQPGISCTDRKSLCIYTCSMNNLSLDLGNIERAARVIDPVFLNSPQYVDEQLCTALGRRVLVKLETLNPIRSFKGRGADFCLQGLQGTRKVVCASAGNFGQAVAYAGRKRGIAVEVFVSTDANPIKVARMKSFGAAVTAAGPDFDSAKQHARQYADQHPGSVFIEDGDDVAISEGAGTIAIELLKGGTLDTLVVPVGDGALITGIAAWIKEHSPKTRVIGVCPSGAPAMFESWRAGKAVITMNSSTIADGIAVQVPVAIALERMKSLVDDLVLVDDAQMLDAMRLAASTLGIVLEPSGAAGLAAIRAHDFPGDQLATILTGSNIHPDLLTKII